MDPLIRLMSAEEIVLPLRSQEARPIADELGRLANVRVYPASLGGIKGLVFAMVAGPGRKGLMVMSGRNSHWDPEILPTGTFAGQLRGRSVKGFLFELSSAAARWVRQRIPFARPHVLGLKRSFGAGDRLGLAGPGHIRAGRQYGYGVSLILAQQSARELVRTQRTHQDVMDAATWAVLQEGYREPWGADADHLKTTQDVDSAAAAGFTMFTIDPGEYVNDQADQLDAVGLMADYERLPWDALQTTSDHLWHQYVGITYRLGDGVELVSETPENLMRAAVKYGRAIAHVEAMSRHIARVMADRPFEIEVSVDETTVPTSVFEHFFVATELKRLGVSNLASLAPRFIGEFEKGIDYKGDLKRFEETIRQHVVVARHCGPYKLSIHSGSDKFSVYPIIARHAGDLVHVKTAGTSYLEALRVIGHVDPDLFREIYAFAYDRYDQDRASYHVSAERASLPKPAAVTSDEMPGLLDRADTRQVFHVTFGSVLTTKKADGTWLFRGRLLRDLDAHEEAHYAALVTHIGRHMEPFAVR